jgi:hypothetical protein
MRVRVTKIVDSFGWLDLLAFRLQSLLNTFTYSAIADSCTFQFTVAHALGLSVFTSRLLATDLNTEISTSNYYEVFLPFLVQSPWNLGTQLKTLSLAASGLELHSRGTDNAENTVLLLRSTDRTENTSQVIAKYCCSMASFNLRGSVFTEPLLRSGLHNPVVPLLVRVLLINGCFCGSAVLARGKYSTIFLQIIIFYWQRYSMR